MGKRERLRSALVDARQIVVDVFGSEHMDPFISLEVAKVLTGADPTPKLNAAEIATMVRIFMRDWGRENAGDCFVSACGTRMFADALIDLVNRAWEGGGPGFPKNQDISRKTRDVTWSKAFVSLMQLANMIFGAEPFTAKALLTCGHPELPIALNRCAVVTVRELVSILVQNEASEYAGLRLSRAESLGDQPRWRVERIEGAPF